MTTTTVEYWSIIPRDGVEYPLQTYAMNIETWGDDRQSVPKLRGSDKTIPWRRGQLAQPRVSDSRVMGLGMWVRGALPGGEAPGVDREILFRKNWMTLKRIFYNQGEQFTLRKRFYNEVGTLITADAQAKFEDGLSPSMLGRQGAKFTVDVRLADPFFYEQGQTFFLNTATATSQVFAIRGDVDCTRLSFTGVAGAAGCSTPSISCLESGFSWSLDATLDPNAVFTMDFEAQIARVNDLNYGSFVNHSGSDYWLKLPFGSATLLSDRASGNWSGYLTSSPTWM